MQTMIVSFAAKWVLTSSREWVPQMNRAWTSLFPPVLVHIYIYVCSGSRQAQVLTGNILCCWQMASVVLSCFTENTNVLIVSRLFPLFNTCVQIYRNWLVLLCMIWCLNQHDLDVFTWIMYVASAVSCTPSAIVERKLCCRLSFAYFSWYYAHGISVDSTAGLSLDLALRTIMIGPAMPPLCVTNQRILHFSIFQVRSRSRHCGGWQLMHTCGHRL
jgi:hypothetical protein